VEALLFVLAALLVLVGLAGTLLPALPGAPLVFAGLFLAAWADGFAHVGAGTLAILAVLTVASFGVDFAATALGAKRAGASPRALVGAVLGTLVGLFFGIPGLLLGPFLGAALGEWTAHRELRRAGRVGLATWLGLLLGSAARLALACAMVGVFAAAWWL
jgi:uncharacterized protein YqgC (DUF456 family)